MLSRWANFELAGHASRFTRGEMLRSPVISTYKSMNDTSNHGGFGDPTTASAEKGERMLQAVTGQLRLLCEDFLADRL